MFVLCGCPHGCRDGLADWRTRHPNKVCLAIASDLPGTLVAFMDPMLIPTILRGGIVFALRELSARHSSPDITQGVFSRRVLLWEGVTGVTPYPHNLV